MFLKIDRIVIVALNLVFLSSCNDTDTPSPMLEVPETYVFTRDGQSSVSYAGQTARLDMLTELKAYLNTANDGTALLEQTLLNMYANKEAPFSVATLNDSGKDLESKTFLADVQFFRDVLTSASAASENSEPASQGTSGLLSRGADRFILINEKGWEYTQIIEKGLMGAVFLDQIFNVYLTEEKIGNQVENELLSEVANYTAMEHHWDEAFGYWGVPVDFDVEGENRFLGNYTNGREGSLSSATNLKDAYLKGRTAIVNKQYDLRDAQRDIIYDEFELTIAATTIHYINEGLSDLSNGDIGNLLHHISEGYGFARALKYSPYKQISDAQLNTLLNDGFGTNADFWTISVDKLNNAKTILAVAYPDLAAIADEL